jgi:hypothetical protein
LLFGFAADIYYPFAFSHSARVNLAQFGAIAKRLRAWLESERWIARTVKNNTASK